MIISFETQDGRHGTIETDMDLEWGKYTDEDKIGFAEMFRDVIADLRANPCPEVPA